MDTLGPHIFACNSEIFLYERGKCIEVDLSGPKFFVPQFKGFINLWSLLSEVPLYYKQTTEVEIYLLAKALQYNFDIYARKL